jgi:hypothetical protein
MVAKPITGWYGSRTFKAILVGMVAKHFANKPFYSRIVSTVGEVAADVLPHSHPPLVAQVEHVPLLLLSPLTPPVSSSMLDSNVTKPVSPPLIVSSDSKCIQTGSKLNSVVLVIFIYLLIDPVNFLQVVLVARVRDRTIVLKPTDLWWVQEGGHSKGVLDFWMVILSLLFHSLPHVLDALHDVVTSVPLHHVIQTSYQQYIHANGHSTILAHESFVQMYNFCTRNSDIVSVGFVPLVQDFCSSRRSKPHVQGGGGEHKLDSVLVVSLVDLFA